MVDPDPGVFHAIDRKIRENIRKEETILLIVTVAVEAADPVILPILQEVIAVIVTHHIPVEVVVGEEVDKGNHGEEVEATVPVLVGLLFLDQTPDRLLQAEREVEGIRVKGKGLVGRGRQVEMVLGTKIKYRGEVEVIRQLAEVHPAVDQRKGRGLIEAIRSQEVLREVIPKIFQNGGNAHTQEVEV